MSTSSGWAMAKATPARNCRPGSPPRRRPCATRSAATGSVTLLGQLGRHGARRDDAWSGCCRAVISWRSPFGEGAHRVLGRRIDRAADADLVAGDRGDVDDMPGFLPLHVRQRRGDAVEHALDVDVDHPVPVLDPQRVEPRLRHQAGVVDDDVDAAAGLDRRRHQRLDLRRGRRRRSPRPSALPSPPQSAPAPRCGRRGGRPRTSPRAFGREQARRRLAEAAAGAGDDDDLAVDALGRSSLSAGGATGQRPERFIISSG